ncbi:MAG: hypothetical protein K0R63_1262 [Rickettsiales bacterium]|jgi:hypothetical protein|nr:hypothetical protein [Rickettsiales bacterium]
MSKNHSPSQIPSLKTAQSKKKSIISEIENSELYKDIVAKLPEVVNGTRLAFFKQMCKHFDQMKANAIDYKEPVAWFNAFSAHITEERVADYIIDAFKEKDASDNLINPLYSEIAKHCQNEKGDVNADLLQKTKMAFVNKLLQEKTSLKEGIKSLLKEIYLGKGLNSDSLPTAERKELLEHQIKVTDLTKFENLEAIKADRRRVLDAYLIEELEGAIKDGINAPSVLSDGTPTTLLHYNVMRRVERYHIALQDFHELHGKKYDFYNETMAMEWKDEHVTEVLDPSFDKLTAVHNESLKKALTLYVTPKEVKKYSAEPDNFALRFAEILSRYYAGNKNIRTYFEAKNNKQADKAQLDTLVIENAELDKRYSVGSTVKSEIKDGFTIITSAKGLAKEIQKLIPTKEDASVNVSKLAKLLVSAVKSEKGSQKSLQVPSSSLLEKSQNLMDSSEDLTPSLTDPSPRRSLDNSSDDKSLEDKSFSDSPRASTTPSRIHPKASKGGTMRRLGGSRLLPVVKLEGDHELPSPLPSDNSIPELPVASLLLDSVTQKDDSLTPVSDLVDSSKFGSSKNNPLTRTQYDMLLDKKFSKEIEDIRKKNPIKRNYTVQGRTGNPLLRVPTEREDLPKPAKVELPSEPTTPTGKGKQPINRNLTVSSRVERAPFSFAAVKLEATEVEIPESKKVEVQPEPKTPPALKFQTVERQESVRQMNIEKLAAKRAAFQKQGSANVSMNLTESLDQGKLQEEREKLKKSPSDLHISKAPARPSTPLPLAIKVEEKTPVNQPEPQTQAPPRPKAPLPTPRTVFDGLAVLKSEVKKQSANESGEGGARQRELSRRNSASSSEKSHSL